MKASDTEINAFYHKMDESTIKNDVVALDFSDDIDAPNKYQTADGKWHEGKISETDPQIESEA